MTDDNHSTIQPTNLEGLDYGVIGCYLAVTLLIGLWFTRRGTRDLSSFFVGGRTMAWWFVGISITATAFAADTPLWIGDMIYRRGVEGVWLHWTPGIGAAFYVFVIAPLWRRTGVVTDAEFLELRYSGKAAAVMRGLNGCFNAFFWNIGMMAVGILSITKVLESTCGMEKGTAVLITTGTAMVYCIISGIWGVCATDFMQFFVYLIGSTLLAFFAVNAAGGLDSLVTQVRNMGNWAGHDLSVFPDLSAGGLPLMTVLFIFTLRWLEHTNYGYFIGQRLFSTRSEKHALWAALLWVAIYWSIIPLPWILTVLASKVVLPGLAEGQEAYPRMAMAVLPVGLRGLLIVSLMAAFMSTFSSLLNWGTSYTVNDLYKRFLVRKAGARHYVIAGQIMMVPMGLAAAIIAYQFKNILDLLFIIILVGAGAYSVHLARWLWWRVNAFSEIAAMLGSIFLTVVVVFAFPDWVKAETMEPYYGHRMFFVMIGAFVIWIAVTFFTPPVDGRTLDSFYTRVRPPGFWQPVRARLGLSPAITGKQILCRWAMMLAAIFGPLVGLLKLAFGEVATGSLVLAIGLTGIALAVRQARRFTDDAAGVDNNQSNSITHMANVSNRPGENSRKPLV